MRKFGTSLFAIVLALGATGLWAQRRSDDQRQFEAQERHIDNTDKDLKEVRELAEELRERIDRDEGYAIGFMGCLSLGGFVGLMKLFQRGKESNG